MHIAEQDEHTIWYSFLSRVSFILGETLASVFQNLQTSTLICIYFFGAVHSLEKGHHPFSFKFC